MNNRIYSAITIAMALSASCYAADDTGGCKTNFATSGSFLSGKQYKTLVHLPETSSEVAFKKTYAAVVKHGYQITQSDKDAGVISASQQVSYSSGAKTAPFNVVIEGVGNGSKISFSFATAGGLMASANTVEAEFCKIADEISVL